MAPGTDRRPKAFLIRVERSSESIRGEIVAVATGAVWLFDDLQHAMALIEAGLEEHDEMMSDGADRL